MSYLFFGYLLVYLDLHININQHVIGLLPDFVGFILLTMGLKALSDGSPRFDNVRPFAVGMAVLTGIVYALNVVGVFGGRSWLSVGIGLAVTALTQYISYMVVMGIKDMEEKYQTDLNADSLKKTWIPMAVMAAVSYVGLLSFLLTVLCSIVQAVLVIVFLVQLNRTKKLWEAAQAARPPMETEQE